MNTDIDVKYDIRLWRTLFRLELRRQDIKPFKFYRMIYESGLFQSGIHSKSLKTIKRYYLGDEHAGKKEQEFIEAGARVLKISGLLFADQDTIIPEGWSPEALPDEDEQFYQDYVNRIYPIHAAFLSHYRQMVVKIKSNREKDSQNVEKLLATIREFSKNASEDLEKLSAIYEIFTRLSLELRNYWIYYYNEYSPEEKNFSALDRRQSAADTPLNFSDLQLLCRLMELHSIDPVMESPLSLADADYDSLCAVTCYYIYKETQGHFLSQAVKFAAKLCDSTP